MMSKVTGYSVTVVIEAVYATKIDYFFLFQ